MSLPMNEQYATLTGAMKPLLNTAQAVARTLPSRKSVDVSRYGNLAKTVGQTGRQTIGATTPQYGGGLREGQQTSLGTVTTRYGGSTNYEKFHPGVDIANKIGTPIKSFTPGTVTSVVGGKKQGDKGYGNYVEITDAQGNRQRYSHLQGAYVKVGQKIPKGYTIAGMGNTGSTYSTSGGTGSHLDYRIWDTYNRYVNPTKYING